MLYRYSAFAVALLVTVLALSAPAEQAQAQTAQTVSSIKLPFPAGSAWRVIQGYNGGTHIPGPEQYALDIVRDGGPTGGAEVIAPASGAVWFAHAPGAGNGCMSLKVDGGGGLIVQLCHIVLNRALRPDERITAGMPLGVIGEDGRVGNNGLAHLHLSMHRTPNYGVTRIPAPFVVGGGLTLEGLNLPPDGSRNQYACPGASCPGKLVSTNGLPAGASPSVVPSPAPTTSGGSIAPPLVAAPPPGPPVPAAAPTTSPPPAPRPATSSEPPVLRAGVRAVVAGAGDCVNIREQPSTSATVKQCLPDGARLKVLEGPTSADGYQWWRLEGLGWAVSDYLSPLAPALESGGRARVTVGRGECLNIRSAPAIASPASDCLADGLAVRLESGPFEADGRSWWRIEGVGWVSGEYLTPEE